MSTDHFIVVYAFSSELVSMGSFSDWGEVAAWLCSYFSFGVVVLEVIGFAVQYLHFFFIFLLSSLII